MTMAQDLTQYLTIELASFFVLIYCIFNMTSSTKMRNILLLALAILVAIYVQGKLTPSRDPGADYVTEKICNNKPTREAPAIHHHLALRPALYASISSISSKGSAGNLSEAVARLNSFFAAVDKGILSTNRNYLALNLHELRRKRSALLNDLQSLQFSMRNRKKRGRLHAVIRATRLETLRALSSLVTLHQRREGAVRLMDHDLGAARAMEDNGAGTFREVF
jgi:hypothetical protein